MALEELDALPADRLPYYGTKSVVQLRGPSSSIVKIPFESRIRVQWAPEDRRVTPLEIRAQILSWTEDPAAPTPISPPGLPIVRLRMGYGHAQQTLYEPPFGSAQAFFSGPPPPPPAPTPPQYEALPVYATPIPARGFIGRITARELAVDLTFASNGPARGSVTVMVSVQPVEGMPLPCIGRGDHLLQVLPGDFATSPAALFPAWATEWKVFDRVGRPLPTGLFSLYMFDLQGQAFSNVLAPDGPVEPEPYDASTFADWTPISLEAFAWRGGAAVGTSLFSAYR